MKDERLVSEMEGKTNFSRHLKQFDGLTWLTLNPYIYDRSTPLIELVHCYRKLTMLAGVDWTTLFVFWRAKHWSAALLLSSMRCSMGVWYANVCGRTVFCVLASIACWTTLSATPRSKVNELWPRNVTSSRTRPPTSGWTILTRYGTDTAVLAEVLFCNRMPKGQTMTLS